MKEVKAIYINDSEVVEMVNELGKIEERKPHDSVLRLLRRSLRAKLGRLKKKKGD